MRKHFQVIDSTNTWVKQNAHLLPRDQLTLITADSQTAGRGRFKRQWVSPPGLNIYATYGIFIDKHRTDIGNLPQVLALSAAKTLEKLGFNPKLKWPNDVMLSNKKVAGILCETTSLSDQLCVALGIGLNVNMPLLVLEGIDRPATSLMVEDGHERKPEDVMLLLHQQFSADLDTFLKEGFQNFLALYRKRLAHKTGEKIRFHDNRIVWEGTFARITEEGALSLLMDDAKEKIFIAGEIV